jgi:hypothetical protein
MYLQLAESPRRGKVAVSSYKRSSTVSAHKRRYPTLSEEAESNPYIFVPDHQNGGGVHVREDKFDNLSDREWGQFMKRVAPYQHAVESGTLSESTFLASRSDRKARRKEKKDNKIEKDKAKTDKKKAKNEIKMAKAQKKRDQGEAKKTKADGKGGKKGFDWDKAADIGGKLVSKFTNKGADGGGDGSGGGDGGSDGGESKPFLKSTAGIVTMSVLGLAVVGGIGYAVTRK